MTASPTHGELRRLRAPVRTWEPRTWELGCLYLHCACGPLQPATLSLLCQSPWGSLAHGQGSVRADHQDAQADPEHHLDETNTQELKESCSPGAISALPVGEVQPTEAPTTLTTGH